MKNVFTALSFTALLSSCAFYSDGSVGVGQPTSVQGSNDAQGAPISTPGAGIGVGAGNPGGATGAGAGTGSPTGR